MEKTKLFKRFAPIGEFNSPEEAKDEAKKQDGAYILMIGKRRQTILVNRGVCIGD